MHDVAGDAVVQGVGRGAVRQLGHCSGGLDRPLPRILVPCLAVGTSEHLIEIDALRFGNVEQARTDGCGAVPCHADGRGSSDALQVGPHHVGHAANLGEAPDVIDGYLGAGPGVLEGLQRHVQADLVAVLEAIRCGLGHAVHAELDAIAFNLLDACLVGFPVDLA